MAQFKATISFIVWSAMGAKSKYVGQTRNMIINRFKARMFDIKHTNNITVARHFHSYSDQLDLKTVHISEYIRLPEDTFT